MTSIQKQWENEILSYLVQNLEKEFSAFPSLFKESLDWWIVNREKYESVPEEYRKNIILIEKIVERGKELYEKVNYSQDSLHDISSLEQDNTKENSGWFESLAKIVLKEGSQHAPYWYSPFSEEREPALLKLVGSSPLWVDTMRMIRIAAMSNVTCLIIGETGTGKDLIAKVLHEAGKRRTRPFVRIPCATINENDCENILSSLRQPSNDIFHGKILGDPITEVGTIYFDGINELNIKYQKKLIEIFHQIEKINNESYYSHTPRIITSSVKSLESYVVRAELNKELYYRLSVFQINLPPLRKRREDLEKLTYALLPKLASKHKLPVPDIERQAFSKMARYPWPGNIRELENVLERGLLLTKKGIKSDHIMFEPIELNDIEPFTQEKRVHDAIAILKEKGFKFGTIIPETLIKFLFTYAKQHFRGQDLALELGVASSTARTYLARLNDCGIIRKYGVNKGTTYTVNINELKLRGEKV